MVTWFAGALPTSRGFTFYVYTGFHFVSRGVVLYLYTFISTSPNFFHEITIIVIVELNYYLSAG